MKYSEGLKNNILKQVLPPEKRSISEVSRDYGVADQTIRNWLNELKSGTIEGQDDRVSPEYRNIIEKFDLLLQSKTLHQDDVGEWLRGHGLHSEHPDMYEQDVRMALSEKDKKAADELKRLKAENAQLQKELAMSEKALAKASALLVLKKKVDAIWGEQGDD